TTYGKPFSNLDRLKPGDPIILETPIGRCTYEVSRAPFTVRPDDFSVVANTPTASTLTLTTCHPKGSAKERLIIRATMVQGGEVKA
ncbi:MAG: class E sortase, partial [Acidimicrobiales bacterium]